MKKTDWLVKILLPALLAMFLAGGSAMASKYIVSEGDVLQINVYGHDDLTTIVRVSGSGTITVPLLGQVEVKGLTTPQISAKIVSGLAGDYIIDPQVNVFITDFRIQNIFVNGQVKKPGAFEFEEGMTLIQLISKAGGFTNLAAQSKVRIIRQDNGQEKIIEKAAFNSPLMPGDVIIVPESFF